MPEVNPSTAPEPTPRSAVRAADDPLQVHVLFMDIVGSSSEPSDDQRRKSSRLKEIVAGTRDFQEASARGELISLPTGDGMALVFLRTVEAPLRCAIEIAAALRADPFCKLRQGIHSGLVLLTEDINGKRNVSGSGINLAERVMSCGGAEHILVSGAAAESLRSLAAWRDKLHYLGEYRAKKDWVHVWNYRDGAIGSTQPLKAKRRRHWAAWAAVAALVCIAAAASVALLLRGPETSVGGLAGRSLSYTLQLRPDEGAMREVAPGTVLSSGARIKLTFSSPEGGYLYLLAEDAANTAGQSWVWLFPEPNFQMGSGEMRPGRTLTVPTAEGSFIRFDAGAAEEIYRVIFADKPISDLEAVKRDLFTRMSDELSPSEAIIVAAIVQQTPTAEATTQGASTSVRAKGPTLVAEFTIRHE